MPHAQPTASTPVLADAGAFIAGPGAPIVGAGPFQRRSMGKDLPMPYFIDDSCIDVMDKSCTENCPADCIYEGKRKLYINPAECIDCGACEPVCPQDAVFADWQAPDNAAVFLADNKQFFDEPLPGRSEPIGNPGGSDRIGPAGADTPLVQSWAAGS